MNSPSSLRLIAPAKINLFLHITGKRQDGYHDLQSLVCFADFGDEIIIEPCDKFSFIQTGKLVEGDNIIIKAANAIATATNQSLNCKITLNKNIPIGAGLGGGSSNAATIIKGLLKFWQVKEPESIHEILYNLGADVPCCYHGKSCYFEGIGDVITPVSLPSNLYAVLINPNKHCATKDIFQKIKPPYHPIISLPKSFENQDQLIRFLKQQDNDMTLPAIHQVPDIKNILDYLSAQPNTILTRMSGSGATCFALTSTKEQTETLTQQIQSDHPEWWVQAVKLK